MGWEQIKELSNEAFRRLTGIQKPTFEKMIVVLREASTATKDLTGRTTLQALFRR